MRKAICGAVCVGLLSAGCMPAKMLRADPVRGDHQDVIYKSGVPIIVSELPNSELVIQPFTTGTGRYDMQSRVRFVLAIRNLGAQRIEVSESNVVAVASGEQTHVVRATEEIEDEIRTVAAWADALNLVAGAMEASSSPRWARYEVARNTAATSTAIAASARMQAGRLASAIQRTTLEPGESIVGGIAIDAPRSTACSLDPVRSDPIRPDIMQERRPGPCDWTLYVSVGGDRHVLRFREALGR